MFSCLPFVKPCGKQIDHIDRRHAKLDQVPDEVLHSFRTLEECRLDANQIKELPKNFFRLERIRYLTLSDNDLTRIPPGLGNFSQLVELDVSRNDILELPPSIRLCDSLQIIDISNNPLQNLPNGFCQLRNLRVLCMNDISIAELPVDIGNLHLLEKLEARDNCLKSLPDSFSQLSRLEFLDLGANEFYTLPPVLGQLQNLTELWMDDNQLKSVPKELGNMKRLQQLDLSENLIDALPEEIAGLTALSDLNLSQNSLNCLPTGFGELKKLAVLKLNQNQLLTLNPSIGGCTSLQELYLTENFLSTLPATIGSLESMFLLNVDQNQLCELPSQIGQCTSLNILSLRENLLHRLPNEIGNCNRLRVLDVSGNRLERLPLSLARCPLTALWLSQNQSQPVVTLQRDVDEVTHEEFLTCYLLPQDQLETQTELDPTMSPSELASLTGGPPASGAPPVNLNELDAIGVETNYEYEPAVTDARAPETRQYRSPFADAKCAQPESVNSSSSTPTSAVLSPPISPTGTHPPTDYGTNSPAGQRGFSVSPRTSLTNQTGDWDPGASRVHFTTSTKQDEMREKSSTKGFPKTRHPRFSKKPTDNAYSTREDSSYLHSNDLASIDESRTSVPNSPIDVRPPSIQTSPSPRGLDDSHMNGIPLSTVAAARLATFDSWRQSDGSFASSPAADQRMDHRNSPPLTPAFSEDEESRRSRRTGPSSQHPSTALPDETGTQVGASNTPHAKPRKKAFQLYGTPTVAVSGASPAFIDRSMTSPHASSPSTVRAPDQPSSRLKKNTNAGETDSQNRLDVNSNVDEDAYSSGGEEICVISRRVGFTDDVEDNEEKSNQKLIRRDTPHYTKRARIQPKTADGVDSEEAVLKILEKYRASAAPNQVLSELPNSEVGGALKILAAATALNSAGTASGPNTARSSGQTQQLVVHIHRQPGSGLGLSIAGGVGSVPFQGSDHGIFVSRLNPTGLACASGLRLNDKLLEVNGISLVDVDHQVAVSALRAQTNDFRIVVSRDPSLSAVEENPSTQLTSQPTIPTGTASNPVAPVSTSDQNEPKSLIKCTIHRDSAGLGFSIVGGRGALPAAADHDRITISKITEGGAASKCGNLFVGDQIIKINGIDVQDARQDQAIALLTGAGAQVDLEILRAAPTSTAAAVDAPLFKTTTNGYLTPPGSRISPVLAFTDAHRPLSSTALEKRTKESWLGDADTPSERPPSKASSTPRTLSRPVCIRHEKGILVERVTIRLDGGPLGLAIYGGADVSCQPFSNDEPGVFISKISNEGAAQNSGLRVGDRILRVNDIDLRNATHDEAVRALIQPSQELQLEVRRDPTPPGLRRLTITRKPGERFGLRISGGLPPVVPDGTATLNGSLGRRLSSLSNDGSILVTWVSSDGAIGRDGRLKPGDRLLEVNGQWMMGSTLEEALSVFRKAESVLNLIVCDGPLDPLAFKLPDGRIKPINQLTSTDTGAAAEPACPAAPSGFSVDHLDERSGQAPAVVCSPRVCSGDAQKAVPTTMTGSVKAGIATRVGGKDDGPAGDRVPSESSWSKR